jgi:hypothetical protein
MIKPNSFNTKHENELKQNELKWCQKVQDFRKNSSLMHRSLTFLSIKGYNLLLIVIIIYATIIY